MLKYLCVTWLNDITYTDRKMLSFILLNITENFEQMMIRFEGKEL